MNSLYQKCIVAKTWLGSNPHVDFISEEKQKGQEPNSEALQAEAIVDMSHLTRETVGDGTCSNFCPGLPITPR